LGFVLCIARVASEAVFVIEPPVQQNGSVAGAGTGAGTVAVAVAVQL